MLDDAFGKVYWEKLASIISTVPKGHLCEVIGSEGEEFCFFRDLFSPIDDYERMNQQKAQHRTQVVLEYMKRKCL